MCIALCNSGVVCSLPNYKNELCSIHYKLNLNYLENIKKIKWKKLSEIKYVIDVNKMENTYGKKLTKKLLLEIIKLPKGRYYMKNHNYYEIMKYCNVFPP